MGRAPCCDKNNVKNGPWSPEEDAKLKSYIEKHGTGGNWIALPRKIGLKRCGKSCRLRWLNYLRPNIKHGGFTEEEENLICNLYINIGSRWSIIAAQLPGRTDNDIKNYWNTRLKKKLLGSKQTSKEQNNLRLSEKNSTTRKQLEINKQACNKNINLSIDNPYCFGLYSNQNLVSSSNIQDNYQLHESMMSFPKLPSDHQNVYNVNSDIFHSHEYRPCERSISSSFTNGSTDFGDMINGEVANNGFQEITTEIPYEILLSSMPQNFHGLADVLEQNMVNGSSTLCTTKSSESFSTTKSSESFTTSNWGSLDSLLYDPNYYVLPSFADCNREAARGCCIDDQFVSLI